MLMLSPPGAWIPPSAVALPMGLLMGWAANRILKTLGRREADSLVRSDDLIGQQGRVSLTIEPGERGFVELNVRGSLIRRPARGRQGQLRRDTSVVVIRADANTLEVEALEKPD